MANFNWFSRTFEKESKPAASEKAAEDSLQEDPSAAATEAATPQTSPEDYLAWAKAAYQTIQKQQVAETSASPEATDEPETSEVKTQTEDRLEPAAETGPSKTAEAEVTSESGSSQPEDSTLADAAASESLSDESTAIADTAQSVPEPTSGSAPLESMAEPAESRPAPVASGPVWMQSATVERQARLERLQEAAIVEPEPEGEPSSIAEAAPAEIADSRLPDIEFDEAFLWSAEVLASQGRRASDVSIEEITWLTRLRQGLDKTRRGLINDLKAIVGQGPLNEDAVFEIEASLLQADVGVEATDAIIEALQQRLREETLPPDQAIAYLKKILRDMLDKPLGDSHNLTFVPEKDAFNIWLLTGVNGAGKTTTIGKLAHIAKKSDYRCLIGAADTFRAAAVEQVKAWGGRSGVDVIANPGKNTDPAAVVFDAIAAAQSRNTELLLIDTAGRLQNKKNLMDELAKIRRIIDKKAPGAHVEALLVLDATLGQNGLRQAEVFAEAANLSGVVLTKLDGTAKGGVALAVVQQLELPIRFIGAGEGIEDLRPFSSYEFVEALLNS